MHPRDSLSRPPPQLTPSIMHPHDPAVAAVGLTRMHPRAAKDSLPAIAPRGPSNGSHLPSPASTSAHSDADAATRRVRRSLQGLSLFEIPEGNGPSAPESGLSKSVGNDQPGAGMGAGGFPNPGMAAYGAPGGFSGSVG